MDRSIWRTVSKYSRDSTCFTLFSLQADGSPLRHSEVFHEVMIKVRNSHRCGRVLVYVVLSLDRRKSLSRSSAVSSVVGTWSEPNPQALQLWLPLFCVKTMIVGSKVDTNQVREVFSTNSVRSLGGTPGGGAHQECPNGAGGLMGLAEWEGTEGVGDPKRKF